MPQNFQHDMFPPDAPENVILPEPNLYNDLDIRDIHIPFYEKYPTPRSIAFDARDDIHKYAPGSNHNILSLQKGLKIPYYINYPAIGILKQGYVNKMSIYSREFKLLLGIKSSTRFENPHQILKINENLSTYCKKKYSGKSALLTVAYSTNFYHFTAETLYFFEILEKMILTENYDRLIICDYPPNKKDFREELIKILFPNLWDKIIFDHRAFHAEHLAFVISKPKQYYFDEKTKIYTTFSPPSDTITRAFIHAPMIDVFKRAENIIGHIPLKERKNIIIISRKIAPTRHIINEDQLLHSLNHLGAKLIQMENYSIREQMNLVANARVIIGCHGAGMANSLFLQKDARAIELTSRQYVRRSNDFRRFSSIRNIDYDFIYCDEEGESETLIGNKGNDIRLSQIAISKIVELCEDTLSRS